MKANIALSSVLGTFLLCILSGCHASVSFKSADFSGERLYSKAHTGPQLNETDVLGIKTDESLTDADIQKVLDEAKTLKIQPGGTVMLVQSGSSTPDKEMLDELSRHYTVIPYTGIPSEINSQSEGPGLSKALRLAAAQSKAEHLVVYWGMLEVKRDDLPTSLVSWVPVVDFMVPDEYQKLRMSLRVALVDVRTGHWSTFRTEVLESDGLTTRYAREREPKWHLRALKQKLYASAVEKIRG